MLKIGLVGLPNVGKSTIFNVLTSSKVPAENYPFCTIKPHESLIEVDDLRLTCIAEISKSLRVVKPIVQITDIAGLIAGASDGKGMGNDFLLSIRDVDLILHIVRLFKDDQILHVEGYVDPIRDINIINNELLLADLIILEKKITKAKGSRKEILKFMYKSLEEAKNPLNDLTIDQLKLVIDVNLLTIKPVIIVANQLINDEPIDSDVLNYAASKNYPVVTFNNQETSTFKNIINTAYNQLGFISYFTTGPQETRAWPISRGTTAQEAAGKIHSDFYKGFIRGKIISYDDFLRFKNLDDLRKHGKIKMQGKKYIMQDGDIAEWLYQT